MSDTSVLDTKLLSQATPTDSEMAQNGGEDLHAEDKVLRSTEDQPSLGAMAAGKSGLRQRLQTAQQLDSAVSLVQDTTAEQKIPE